MREILLSSFIHMYYETVNRKENRALEVKLVPIVLALTRSLCSTIRNSQEFTRIKFHFIFDYLSFYFFHFAKDKKL